MTFRIDIYFSTTNHFFEILIQADKQEWHRGDRQSTLSEGSRPIDETHLDITRKKRIEELEMW